MYSESNVPADTPLIEFIRLSSIRWPIEIIFEEAKGEAGFDHYEMRSGLGWHHHMLLVALALIISWFDRVSVYNILHPL
jgi:SRSO17 transposase